MELLDFEDVYFSEGSIDKEEIKGWVKEGKFLEFLDPSRKYSVKKIGSFTGVGEIYLPGIIGYLIASKGVTKTQLSKVLNHLRAMKVEFDAKKAASNFDNFVKGRLMYFWAWIEHTKFKDTSTKEFMKQCTEAVLDSSNPHDTFSHFCSFFDCVFPFFESRAKT